MTTVTLSKWGNAQGVRIPKDMRERLGLREGEKLEAEVKDGAIVLTPERRTPRIVRPVNLRELFADRDEPYNAGDDPFGPAAGSEVW
ncbi:MAG: AbrB/MazE/SpoVT family DNA-binding domain-containing protein [Bifidobacterium sp.]|nr:AbrB/MazE/SpoVT family DNA-binding domain-containing protein [Bifidobacterium sp.]